MAAAVKYRARVYVGRAVDSTEATVLTPAAGGSHSDAFQVASVTGETGYQPYLDRVEGRPGQYDPVDKRTDTGRLTLTLLDKRVAETNNAQRWVVNFFGDADDILQLVGHRVEVDADYSDGSGWVRFFTGRIERVTLQGKQLIALELRDMAQDLRGQLWSGDIHSSITYAVRASIFPSGFIANPPGHGSYMSFPTNAEAAEATALAISGDLVGLRATSGWKGIWFVGPRFRAMVPRTVFKASDLKDLLENGSSRLRSYPGAAAKRRMNVWVKHTSGVNNGSTGLYRLEYTVYLGDGAIVGMTIHALRKPDGTPDTGHPDYLAVPANGVTCQIWIEDTSPPTKDNPLYLNNVHPGQLLQDILDGKFGPQLSTGAPKFTFGYDATAMTALKNKGWPSGYWIITDEDKVSDWVEQNLCQGWGFGYYLNAEGKVVPFDSRVPTSLGGIPALTDADAATDPEGWGFGMDDIVTRVRVTYFEDFWMGQDDESDDVDTELDLPLGEREYDLLSVDFGRERTVGQKNELEIEAKGLRFRVVDLQGWTFSARKRVIEGFLESLIELFRWPFGAGASFLQARFLRNTSTKDLAIGDWVGGTFAAVPNPATNERGGQRLYLVVGVRDEEQTRHLTLLDYGKNVASSAPTVGTLAQVAGNTKHEQDVTITLGGDGDPVRVDIAITDSSGTLPAETSAEWSYYTRVTATGTVQIRQLPANSKLWLRARTESGDADDPKLPSAWVHPSNDGLLTAALTAPSGTSDSVSGGLATLTWTNGETNEVDGALELFVETPAPVGDPTTFYLSLPVGTKEITIELASGSTEYKWGVRHRDIYGGVSAMATDTFTTGTLNPAPSFVGDPVLLWGIEA